MVIRLSRSSSVRADWRSSIGWRMVLPRNRKLFLWQIVTAPWWVWSDRPKSSIPVRERSLSHTGLAGDWLVRRLDRIVLRLWVQRVLGIVARGVWLMLLLGCFWLLVEFVGGPDFDVRLWGGVGIVLLVASTVVAITSRPSRYHTARMLDRSFDLQQRIETALDNLGHEIPVSDASSPVVALQIADAANAITIVRSSPAFRIRLPIRESAMIVLLALVFTALLFARGWDGGISAVQPNPVPAFIPAADRFVQTANDSASNDATPSDEDQSARQLSIDNQRDLQILAAALTDHALTHGVAESIQQGAYAQAAESLRTISEQVDQASEVSRTDLANDLATAATQMSDGNTTLAGSTQTAADGLREGGSSAQTGVRDLANAIEQSGRQAQSGESDGASGDNGDQSITDAQSSQGAGGMPQGASASGTDQTGDGTTDTRSGPGGEPGTSTDGSSAGDSGEMDDATSDESSDVAGSEPNGTGAANEPGTSGDGEESGDTDSGSREANTTADGDGGESGDSDQGSGVGGAGGSGNTQSTSGTDTNGTAQNATAPKTPAEPDVIDAETTGTSPGKTSADMRTVVQLPRSSQGEQVQIGGSANGSRSGSGAGVTVSGGSAQQGAVVEAGPESNHVPADYRSIVENYFSGKERGG